MAWLAGFVLGYLSGHWGLDAAGVRFVEAVWKSFQPHEARDWLPLLLVLLVATGAAAMLALSGSLTTGQLLDVVAAAMGGCGAAALLLRVESGPEAAPGPMIAAVGGLLMVAYLFVDGVTPIRVALLVVSLAAALTVLPPSRRWQIGFCTAACLVPLVIAVAMAASEFAAAPSAPDLQPEANPYLNWEP